MSSAYDYDLEWIELMLCSSTVRSVNSMVKFFLSFSEEFNELREVLFDSREENFLMLQAEGAVGWA